MTRLNDIQSGVSTTKRRLSKLAVFTCLLSLPVTTSISALAFLFGLAGWIHLARRPDLRGRGLVRLALFLGGLSLWCQFWQYPIALLQPPLSPADHELRDHLNDIAAGRYDEAYNDPAWPHTGDISRRDFAFWADDLNQDLGKPLIVWGKQKTLWGAYQAQYYVYFEKAGLRTINVWGDLDRKIFYLERADDDRVALR